jgi:ATP-dependent protease Clp ATPase subunit
VLAACARSREEVLLPVMYDIPSRDDVAEVVVTKETMEDILSGSAFSNAARQ